MLFFTKNKNVTYQELLQCLYTTQELSKENLHVALASCDLILNTSEQTINQKLAIYFSKAEIYTRLMLISVDENNPKEAVEYYSLAFESCDFAEAYRDQLQEQQQIIDEDLLKISNSFGITTLEAYRDKIFELAKAIDPLFNKKFNS